MKTTGARRPLVLAAVVGVLAAAVAYPAAQRSAGQPANSSTAGAPSRGPTVAEAAEAAIARADLVGRLETALGSEYAGAWFDSQAARLNVGIVSPASQARAEATVARVGLTSVVAEMTVRHTWAELESAQERWSDRLDRRLADGSFATGLDAAANAVRVELAASVSVDERTALRREAEAAAVDVRVIDADVPDFRLPGQVKRCNKFAMSMSDCEPTIVSGVAIEPVKHSITCSAGPVAIRTERSNGETATTTYLLTAGHCIRKYGGTGEKWRAFNKAGEEKEIGEAVQYVNEDKNLADLGVIAVSSNYWTEEKDPPLSPVIVDWSKEEESDVFAVVKQTSPSEGEQVCYSGQASGKGCGEIVDTNFKSTVEGVKLEKLVKVKLDAESEAIAGDSGSPWYSKSTPGYVLGTHVSGATIEGKNYGYFQRLDFSLVTLALEKALSLELLTGKNEKRHDPKLWGESSPLTIDGEGTTAQVFKRSSRTVSCEVSSYAATTESEVTEVSIVPSYENCVATVLGSELPATIQTNGCSFLHHFEAEETEEEDVFWATTDVVCPESNEIELDIFTNHTSHTAETPTCRYNVGPTENEELAKVNLTNEAAGGEKSKAWVEANVQIEGLRSVRTLGSALLCGSEVDSAGTLEGTVALTGTDEGEEATAIRVNTG